MPKSQLLTAQLEPLFNHLSPEARETQPLIHNESNEFGEKITGYQGMTRLIKNKDKQREYYHFKKIFFSSWPIEKQKRAILKRFRRRRTWTHSNLLTLQNGQGSAINTFYFLLAKKLFSPNNLFELLKLLFPEEINLTDKLITTDVRFSKQGQEYDGNKSDLFVVTEEKSLVQSLKAMPVPDDIDKMPKFVVNEEGFFFLDDLASLDFFNHVGVYGLLNQNYPRLKKQIYNASESLITLKEDITEFLAGGECFGDALMRLLRHLRLGGEMHHGNGEVPEKTRTAIRQFMSYLSKFSSDDKALFYSLKGVGERARTFDLIIDDFDRESCIETLALEIESIIENASNKILLTRKISNDEVSLMQLKKKYHCGRNNQLDIGLLYQYDFPKKLLRDCFKQVCVLNGDDFSSYIVHLPIKYYEDFLVCAGLNNEYCWLSEFDKILKGQLLNEKQQGALTDVLIKNLDKFRYHFVQCFFLCPSLIIPYYQKAGDREKSLILREGKLLLNYLKDRVDDFVYLFTCLYPDDQVLFIRQNLQENLLDGFSNHPRKLSNFLDAIPKAGIKAMLNYDFMYRYRINNNVQNVLFDYLKSKGEYCLDLIINPEQKPILDLFIANETLTESLFNLVNAEKRKMLLLESEGKMLQKLITTATFFAKLLQTLDSIDALIILKEQNPRTKNWLLFDMAQNLLDFKLLSVKWSSHFIHHTLFLKDSNNKCLFSTYANDSHYLLYFCDYIPLSERLDEIFKVRIFTKFGDGSDGFSKPLLLKTVYDTKSAIFLIESIVKTMSPKEKEIIHFLRRFQLNKEDAVAVVVTFFNAKKEADFSLATLINDPLCIFSCLAAQKTTNHCLPTMTSFFSRRKNNKVRDIPQNGNFTNAMF